MNKLFPHNIGLSVINHFYAKLTVSVFSSIIAVVLASIYYLSRVGFSNPLLPIINTLSISLILLNTPMIFRVIFLRFNLRLKDTWITSDAFYNFLILLLLVLTGFLVPFININPISFLCPIGLIIFSFIFLVWFSSRTIMQNLIFVVFTFLFSFWVGATVWNFRYLSPLFLERIIAFGIADHDTLYHAAIAGMIKTYGFPSTGIDGLVYVSYHYGSHWIFSQLSNLLKLNTIYFYNVAYPIIFIPFLYQIALLFVIELKYFMHNANHSWNLRTDYKLWLVFFIIQIGFISSQHILTLSFSWHGHLISESYNLALSFTILLFIMGIYIITSIATKSKSLIDTLFLMVFLPAFIIIIGFIKLSLIFLLLLFTIYFFFRLKLYRQLIYNLSLVFAITSFFLVIYLTGKRPGGIKIFPFHFFFVYGGANPFFFIFYFLFSWLFIILKCYEKNIFTISDFKHYFLLKKIMDIEIVLLFCLVGAAPGLILRLYGGGAHYFSDFQAWIAASLLLANLDNFSKKLVGKIEIGSLGDLKLKYLYITIIGACILFSTGIYYVKPISEMVRENLRTRIQLTIDGPTKNTVPFILAEKKIHEINEVIFKNIKGQIKQAIKNAKFAVVKHLLMDYPYECLQHNKKAFLINKLLELGDIPRSEKKKIILFIPQSNKLYWKLIAYNCIPFLAPAISDIAMIDGLPEINSIFNESSYFNDFQRQKEQAPLEQIKDEICHKAWAQGFSRVIILDADAEANLMVEELHKNKREAKIRQEDS